MGFDRKFLVWALGYAVLGIVVGIYMAASKNHGELVAHAHILLVGFVVSLIYALIHRLWLHQPRRKLCWLQFLIHQTATAMLVAGLLLLYGNAAPEAALAPLLGIGALGVLVGMLLMIFMVIRFGVPTQVIEPESVAPAA